MIKKLDKPVKIWPKAIERRKGISIMRNVLKPLEKPAHTHTHY